MPLINIYTVTIPNGERESSAAIVKNNAIVLITSDTADTFTFQIKLRANDSWLDLSNADGPYGITLAADEVRMVADSSLVGIYAIRAVADADVGAVTTLRFTTLEI
jgi:hypothetical protein